MLLPLIALNLDGIKKVPLEKRQFMISLSGTQEGAAEHYVLDIYDSKTKKTFTEEFSSAPQLIRFLETGETGAGQKVDYFKIDLFPQVLYALFGSKYAKTYEELMRKEKEHQKKEEKVEKLKKKVEDVGEFYPFEDSSSSPPDAALPFYQLQTEMLKERQRAAMSREQSKPPSEIEAMEAFRKNIEEKKKKLRLQAEQEGFNIHGEMEESSEPEFVPEEKKHRVLGTLKKGLQQGFQGMKAAPTAKQDPVNVAQKFKGLVVRGIKAVTSNPPKPFVGRPVKPTSQEEELRKDDDGTPENS